MLLKEYESEIDTILNLIEKPLYSEEANDNNFTGRAKLIKSFLTTNESIKKEIIIKTLTHGGLLAKSVFLKFYKNKFFSISIPKHTRVFNEFKVLIFLRSKGINVPKPVSAIVKACNMPFYYSGYLCLENLNNASTLLDLVNQLEVNNTAKSVILDLCFRSGELASSCLSLGIRHHDLHLGNVLTSHGSCYLIDFDKAKVSSTSEEDLDFLIDRWNKSLIKRVHNEDLKKEMQISFEAGLRKNFIACEERPLI